MTSLFDKSAGVFEVLCEGIVIRWIVMIFLPLPELRCSLLCAWVGESLDAFVGTGPAFFASICMGVREPGCICGSGIADVDMGWLAGLMLSRD